MSYLLQETADRLLQETGDGILLDEAIRGFLIDGDSYNSVVQLAGFSLTECANRGEVGMGGFDVFDDASALDIPALKAVTYSEPAATGNTQVFAGYVHDRAMGAMQDDDLAARMHDVEVTDLNALASDYVLTAAESADRPAETDYVRMAWLMTTRLNSVGGVGVGVIPNTNTVTLEATDYRGRKPADVAAECSEASGKLWFIYDYGAGKKMYYDVATGASLPATLSISDSGTADGSTIFAPQPGVVVKKSPDRIYSTIHLTYNGGTVTVSDGAVATAHRTREAAVLNSAITDSTVATAFANALLDASATELTEVNGLQIVVPAENVNDVRAGQCVTLTLSRQGVTATDYRVIRRNIQPMNGPDGDSRYLLSLDLASDVLASANGSRGPDIIWPNSSNANDDGATVTIDRGGINVIDGAITVVNTGATVIIDGESNMLKIAAEGTQSVSVVVGDAAAAAATTLTGLGALDAAPASVLYHALGNASTTLQSPGFFFSVVSADRYIATTSGGSPTSRVVGATRWLWGYVNLNGSDEAVVTVAGANASASNFDSYQKYFVMQESAF